MKRISKNNRPAIATLAIVILALILAVIGMASKKTGFLKNAAGSVIAPIESFTSKLTSSVSSFFANIFNTTDADKENARLKSELAMREQSLKEFEELKYENERLHALLNYKLSLGDQTGVTARLIGRSTDVYFKTFTVNAGHNRGIDVNMPVIGADGLIGIVSEVGSNWCKVKQITDPSMAVPVMIERTRDVCIARGVMNASAKKTDMELYYLHADRTDLIPGDVVITSGIGGIYPKGIRVGSVSGVLTSTKGGVNAIISPFMDFDHIEEVFIITGEGGDEQ